MKPLVIGTRGSPLALAQAQTVAGLLRKGRGELRVETKIIKTSGDIFQSASLAAGGGKGLFTKEIEDELLAGRIDVAVHSMKDLPTKLPAGLTIGAVPPREDPRDVLIGKRCATVDELPAGARVATSSVRRRAQLMARRPDLHIDEMRGNIGTRLQKLADRADLAATVLAAAGLNRLGLWDRMKDFRWQRLDLDVMIPAAGQGMIACEVREADLGVQELLAGINDADALACAEAERAFLAALGGGCQVPYAAVATVAGNQLWFIGAKFSPDGRDARRTELVGSRDNPREAGERAAKRIME